MEFSGKTFNEIRDNLTADCIDLAIWKESGEKVAQIVWCGDTFGDPDFIDIVNHSYTLSALFESEVENVSMDTIEADTIYIDAIANELYEL